jgi:hypothetical protein
MKLASNKAFQAAYARDGVVRSVAVAPTRYGSALIHQLPRLARKLAWPGVKLPI